MITTTPNSAIAKIHNRMPVILNTNEGFNFLSSDPEKAIILCKPIADSVPANVSVADDILTPKQKQFLEMRK
jgi:putative SOS response-associated peptidase YedK